MSTREALTDQFDTEGVRSWLIERTNDERVKGLLSTGLIFLVLTVFYVVPLLLLFGYSFMVGIEFNQITPTLEHYAKVLSPDALLSFSFGDAIYLKLLLKTLRVSAIVTVGSLIISYPITYYIGQKAPRKYKTAMVMLVIIPFWTSYLIRTYAWIPILSQNGIINDGLQLVGLPTLQLLYTNFATTLGLVYVYLPFMILPLYASMENLNGSLIEAAQDLGAGRIYVFREVIFPLTLPGAVAGSIFIFVKCAAAFITPTLLGGTNGTLYANVIVNQFRDAFNWNFGSALSFVLLAVILLILWLGMRTGYLSETGSMGGAP
jgi:spermidine/putrescine transport system permease protein